MVDHAKVKLVNEVITQLIGHEIQVLDPLGLYTEERPAQLIDLSRPNIHATKKEFLAELELVSKVVEDLRQMLRLFFPSQSPTKLERQDVVSRLRVAIDSLGQKKR